MNIAQQIKIAASLSLQHLYNFSIDSNKILVNQNNTQFEGDYTVVLFSFVKELKKSPEVLGNELGENLITQNAHLFSGYNVVKGFLNLSVNNSFWLQFLRTHYANDSFGIKSEASQKVMVEYASPNTNKPLHLGHLRNIFLGWSIAELNKANGAEVTKTCIVNDRGIHICKSMIAWQLFGNNETPASTHKKGDHFVGDYYVRYNDVFKQQVEELISKGIVKETAEKEAPIFKAAQQMLVDWEAGNKVILKLWKEMNGWVYEGFEATYKTIGADFDKTYYESNTYLLGKKIVQEGLKKNVFFQEEDSSVWIDLTNDGLDRKIVQRKDGTSVYITQDIGLAEQKFEEYGCERSIYVIGDEQNYHMKVLKLICQKLQMPSANGIEHLSYGMVELPTGKMKSREGTVVDADDIVEEMLTIAKQRTEELGKVKDFSTDELNSLYTTIGLGALKFFLLRVDPKKKMIFNPEESIDFNGFTAPFIQYTYARIKSILRRMAESNEAQKNIVFEDELLPLEKDVVKKLEQFTSVIEEATSLNDPSKIAIYCFELAQNFNSFYTNHSIASAENEDKKRLRKSIATLTAHTIKNGMNLLGIQVPERM
jgi:arginyl-tRNA synthetase